MLNINLNLPTLPTQDQKDAMDGANTPDSTNVFVTANDLIIPTLQEVSDAGNTTTNDIQFGTGAGILLNNTSRLREGTIDAGFGGTKGIAQICAVGYELKWEAGRLYVMDGNGLLIRHSLYNFTTVPSANDDDTKGYYVGSLYTLDNGVSYICTDSTSTAATWDIYEDNSLLVPYTGATGDVELGAYDLYANKVWLLDAPNNAYGSIHLTDNNFHIEDSDGHKMLVVEDGFMQIHLSDTIQSNLYTTLLTDIRDHYLPDVSGTIALTSDIVAQVNSDWNATTGVEQILNKPTISGTNTGDQDLSGLAPKASPTFTGTVTSPAIILSSETASTIASFDASKNIKSLPLATYPSLTELSYVKGVTSAIQTQINSKSEKSILLFSSALNPADSSDYYFSIGYIAATTSPSQKRFKFEAGSTTAIKLALQMGNTVAASSELVTLNLRNQTTLTDYLIGTFDMSLVVGNSNWIFEFDFSHTINTTDQWIIKMTTPAWVTNPTSVAMQLKLYYK